MRQAAHQAVRRYCQDGSVGLALPRLLGRSSITRRKWLRQRAWRLRRRRRRLGLPRRRWGSIWTQPLMLW